MDAALVILDGWGLGESRDTDNGRDAVADAHTPNFDQFQTEGAAGTLKTHGRHVGLPDGQMGNSEVGHLTIGAGRIVQQSSTRISEAIENGSLSDNEALSSAFEYASTHDGRVHFMGLVSDGGVHSLQTHLHALINLAGDVPAITHAFTDGRDTPPKSGADYLRELQTVIDEADTGHVATVSGRYYAMDRDENWERTKHAYDAIVNHDGEHTAASAVEGVENAYERGETDEYIVPTLIEDGNAVDDTSLTDGDSVVFFNFRADRARQLTRFLADIRPEWDAATDPPATRVVTMTEYDASFDLPIVFPPNEPHDTLGETIAARGRTQLRIAESEKYAHVTYFLNGGREVEFDGERRMIIDSPDVPTYDQKPSMSAREMTDTAIDAIEREDPSLLVLNYANPDMVGHTGDYDAAVDAVECVDEQLKRLVETCHDAGAHVFITADHGNADDMGTSDDPHTAHTLNPVPFVSLADDEYAVRGGGTLADIAPTLLTSMNIDIPDAMTGESLLEQNNI